jgi:hypothetical protein
MAEKEIGHGGNNRFSQMGSVWSTAIRLSVMQHRLGRGNGVSLPDGIRVLWGVEDSLRGIAQNFAAAVWLFPCHFS